jgi:hypothetical protein
VKVEAGFVGVDVCVCVVFCCFWCWCWCLLWVWVKVWMSVWLSVLVSMLVSVWVPVKVEAGFVGAWFNIGVAFIVVGVSNAMIGISVSQVWLALVGMSVYKQIGVSLDHRYYVNTILMSRKISYSLSCKNVL